MIYIKQKIWENFIYYLPLSKIKAKKDLIELKKYIDSLLEVEIHE